MIAQGRKFMEREESSQSVSSIALSDQSATSDEIRKTIKSLIASGEMDKTIIQRSIENLELFKSILEEKFKELEVSKEDKSKILNIFKLVNKEAASPDPNPEQVSHAECKGSASGLGSGSG